MGPRPRSGSANDKLAENRPSQNPNPAASWQRQYHRNHTKRGSVSQIAGRSQGRRQPGYRNKLVTIHRAPGTKPRKFVESLVHIGRRNLISDRGRRSVYLQTPVSGQHRGGCSGNRRSPRRNSERGFHNRKPSSGPRTWILSFRQVGEKSSTSGKPSAKTIQFYTGECPVLIGIRCHRREIKPARITVGRHIARPKHVNEKRDYRHRSRGTRCVPHEERDESAGKRV